MIKRLKYAVTINAEMLPEETDPDYVLRYVYIGSVDASGTILRAEEMKFRDAPSRARRRVRHGDVIVSTVRTYLRAIALIEHPPANLVVSTGFAVLRPGPGIEPAFLWRLVQSPQFVALVMAHSEGAGYPAIPPARLANLPLWLPPLAEQRAIVAYLERATTRINALIARKESLIALLQEWRAALINRIVTRGLDGQIPAHWRQTTLKRCLISLKDGTHGTFARVSDGVPLLSAKNVLDGRLVITDQESRISYEDFASIHRSGYLQPGDLLLTIVGSIGRVAVFDHAGPLAFQRSVAMLRFRPEHNVRYFYYLAQSACFQASLTSHTRQSAQGGVYLGDMARLPVIVPPLVEQHAIAAYLDGESARIDALITRIRAGIEKLHEYSDALLAGAVARPSSLIEATTP